MFVDGYRCFTCETTQSSGFDGFICPACGGNLDVRYDYPAAARNLENGFDRTRPDIFRFAPVLPIEPRGSFPLRIGGTALYRARRLGESLAAIPGGSQFQPVPAERINALAEKLGGG